HDYAVRRHGPAPSATRRQIILTCILNTTGLWCMLEVSEGAIAPPLDLSGRDSVGIVTNPTIGGIRGGHTAYRYSDAHPRRPHSTGGRVRSRARSQVVRA